MVRRFPALHGSLGPVGTPFSSPQLHPERFKAPLHWLRPRRVFVCSLGDLFHEDVPDDWIDRVFAIMALAPQHRFFVLTRRIDRAQKYLTAMWIDDRITADSAHLGDIVWDGRGSDAGKYFPCAISPEELESRFGCDRCGALWIWYEEDWWTEADLIDMGVVEEGE